MKTSTVPETQQRTMAGRILKYLLFAFMFLQIFILYSCALEYRTPRHERGGVSIERNDRGDHHDHGDRDYDHR